MRWRTCSMLRSGVSGRCLSSLLPKSSSSFWPSCRSMVLPLNLFFLSSVLLVLRVHQKGRSCNGIKLTSFCDTMMQLEYGSITLLNCKAFSWANSLISWIECFEKSVYWSIERRIWSELSFVPPSLKSKFSSACFVKQSFNLECSRLRCRAVNPALQERNWKIYVQV